MNATCCDIFVINERACNLQNVDAVSIILRVLNISLKSDKKQKVLSYTQEQQLFSQNYFYSADERTSFYFEEINV
jgi:hypothetical protein